MARIKTINNQQAVNVEPPALTIEDREDQLIALAVDLAEQRLRDGTASNQLIAEIMKLGTTKERLQKEKLKHENEMLKAKTEALESRKNTDKMYARAINAMRSYAGLGEYEDEYEENNP